MRLRKAIATELILGTEGQIRGIIKMVENDKPCEDILIQIGAAKSALHKTGQAILEGHLQHCVLDGIKDGNEKEVIKKLKDKNFATFSKLNKENIKTKEMTELIFNELLEL